MNEVDVYSLWFTQALEMGEKDVWYLKVEDFQLDNAEHSFYLG